MIRSLTLAFLAPAFALAQTPTTALKASPGQSITITASGAGTFSLAAGSVGTLAAVDSTHATYTAPAHIAPQHILAGCMVQPNDSVFNTRIDSLPVNANNANWTGTVGSSTLLFGFQTDFTHNLIDNTAPSIPQTFYYNNAYNGTAYQFPLGIAKREHGWFGRASGGYDHHEIDLNTQTCHFYETYQAKMVNYGAQEVAHCGTGGCSATGGWHYPSASYSMPGLGSAGGGGTDAPGYPLAPLTLHASEVLEAVRTGRAALGHALRFTSCTGCIYNGTFLWPATGSNGGNVTQAPPYGARFRLKASFDATGLKSVSTGNPLNFYGSPPTSATVTGCTTTPTLALSFAAPTNLTAINVTSPGSGCSANPVVTINGGSCSGTGNLGCQTATANVYSAQAKVILTTLKQYGLILADAGTGNAITVDSDVTTDIGVMTALRQIQATFPMSSFEAVDESSLQVSSLLTEVPVNLASGPAAVVNSTSGPTSFPIALTAASVGIPFVHLGILAGEPAYQIPYWVNGDTGSVGAAWTLATCGAGTGLCGSVTASGLYTPPVSTPASNATITATLVATPNADTQQSTGVYLIIYPAGTSPAGTLRVDIGSLTPTTDSTGNIWLPEQYGEAIEGENPLDNDTYDPSSLWSQSLPNIAGTGLANADIALWQTGVHSGGTINTSQQGGGDTYLDPIVMPNGTYTVQMFFGLTGQSNGPTACWGSYQVHIDDAIGPLSIATQGIIQAHNWDYGIPAKNMCRAPVSLSVPAVVSNRLLNVMLGTDAGSEYETFLNAIKVTPYSGVAHWSIEAPQAPGLLPGSVTQFYVTDWGTGLNDPFWTVSGGGVMTVSGLYTAPASETVTSPVTIKACSISIPSTCGQVNLNVIGSQFIRAFAP